MTKRSIDPDIENIFDIEPWEKEYANTALDKNRFMNFV